MRPAAHHSTRHLGNLWITVSALITLFVPIHASAQLIQLEDELRARVSALTSATWPGSTLVDFQVQKLFIVSDDVTFEGLDGGSVADHIAEDRTAYANCSNTPVQKTLKATVQVTVGTEVKMSKQISSISKTQLGIAIKIAKDALSSVGINASQDQTQTLTFTSERVQRSQKVETTESTDSYTVLPHTVLFLRQLRTSKSYQARFKGKVTVDGETTYSVKQGGINRTPVRPVLLSKLLPGVGDRTFDFDGTLAGVVANDAFAQLVDRPVDLNNPRDCIGIPDLPSGAIWRPK